MPSTFTRQNGRSGLLKAAYLALVFTAACSMSAESRTVSLSAAAESHARAVDALHRGDFEFAEQRAKVALQSDPLHVRSHLLLANLLARRHEIDLAIVGFRRVLSLESFHPEALFNLGTLLLRRGEPVPAAEVLERAVETRPDHVPGFNNLGCAYLKSGLPELAGAAFEEALRRDPDSEIALGNLATMATAAGDSESAHRYRSRMRSKTRASESTKR